ncbi:hypothetical protein [Actinokineospora inagensis]|uniref:hypothetical protein n=1 Tax=Actinokineospora inagensis TaxID=103730 RepID=UPI0004108165|nr:hypothetical protein [Actinokineospora inagensis]
MTRVHDMRQARAMRSESGPVAQVVTDTDVHAGPPGDYRVTGTGSDGVEVDYAALQAADRELAILADDLNNQLRQVGDLAAPLPAGAGLLAAAMEREFVGRTDASTGLRAVLTQYLGELNQVRAAINATLATYQRVDEHAATTLRRVGEEA